MDTAAHRPHRAVRCVSNLVIGEADHVAENDGLAEGVRQLEEGGLDVVGQSNRGQDFVG